MADGIGSLRLLTVHQALHGYVQGHREIASSRQLIARDARTMLALSDLASPGIRLPDDGYLTGYPLPESDCYAIARTWPATDMPRPGCVWTHTLLIPFAALQKIRNASDILDAFRRPTLATKESYTTPFEIRASGGRSEGLAREAIDWTRNVIGALYGSPQTDVIAPAPLAIDVEAAVLALWLQQPTPLRCRFAFCTSTTADRSGNPVRFDLQIMRNLKPGARGPHPERLAAEHRLDPSPAWLDYMLADLLDPHGSLTMRIDRCGGVRGRASVPAAVRLQELIANLSKQPELLADALNAMSDSECGDRTSTMRQIANAVAACPSQLDLAGLRFLVESFALIHDVRDRTAVGIEVWKRTPALVGELVGDESPKWDIGQAVRQLELAEMLEGIRNRPELAELVVRSRPELLYQREYWLSGPALLASAAEYLGTHMEAHPAAARAMIASGSKAAVDVASRCLDSAAVWGALADIINGDPGTPSLGPWIALGMVDKDAAAQALASGAFKSLDALCAVARMTSPDDVPTGTGEDPWARAVNRLADTASSGVPSEYLHAYLLSRAFSNGTHGDPGLFAMTFEKVYRAAERSALDDIAWRLVERYLPDPHWWARWDRCDQLRQIGTVFADRGFDPLTFLRLTDDVGLFDDLVAATARSYRGRIYLSRVRQVLSEGAFLADGSAKVRRSIIETYV